RNGLGSRPMAIRARLQAGWWSGLTLSVLFALVLVPTATFDLFGPPPITAGKVTGFTVRLPEIGIYRDLVSPPTLEYQRFTFAHGGMVARRRAAPLVGAFEVGRRPPAIGLVLGLGLAYLLLGVLFTTYLRNFGSRGRQLRTQIVLLGAVLVSAFAAKAFL